MNWIMYTNLYDNTVVIQKINKILLLFSGNETLKWSTLQLL